MTNKETIYNALGIIEGAVCVSQRNTRDTLMKAVDMIKSVIEKDSNCNDDRSCLTCSEFDTHDGVYHSCSICDEHNSEWKPKDNN